MQIHPSTKKLIDRLYDKTLERKITWKQGEDGAVNYDLEHYRVSLVGNPTEVLLLSRDGVEIDKADHQELTNTLLDDGTTYAEYVKQLHKEAHRIARGAETAIDDVLASLDLDGDGIPDIEQQSPEVERPSTEPSVAPVAGAAVVGGLTVAGLGAAVQGTLPETEDLSQEGVADAVANLAKDVNGTSGVQVPSDVVPQMPDAETPTLMDPVAPPVETVAMEAPTAPVVETPIVEPPIIEAAEPQLPVVNEPIIEAAPEEAPLVPPQSTQHVDSMPPAAEVPTPQNGGSVTSSVLMGGALGFAGFNATGTQPTTPAETPDPAPVTPPQAVEPMEAVQVEPVIETPAAPEAAIPTVTDALQGSPAAEPIVASQPITPPVAQPLNGPEQPAAIETSLPQPQAEVPASPQGQAFNATPASLGQPPQIPTAPAAPTVEAQPQMDPVPEVQEQKIADALGAITETVDVDDGPTPAKPNSLLRGGLGKPAAAGGLLGGAASAVKQAGASVQEIAGNAASALKSNSLGVIDEAGEMVSKATGIGEQQELPAPTEEAQGEEDGEPNNKPPSKRFNPWR